MNDLLELDEWLAGLVERLEPPQRKKLMQQWARTLRRRQQRSIQQQQNPDGTPFAPRKPQKREKAGRVRRKMFTKLRTARFMKAKSTTNKAEVLFSDSNTNQIASTHQFGLQEKLRKLGPLVKYSQRQLLGISETDVVLISSILINHVSFF